jgi:phage baseplate assembly protein W
VDLQAAAREKVSPRQSDLVPVSGLMNLVQSLITRLMTQRGELEALGHSNYGSRHHELIGELNTETNRNLMKLYLIEAIRQEPRVEQIVRIDVQPVEGRDNKHKVRAEIELKAKERPDTLILVVPFSFEEPLP